MEGYNLIDSYVEINDLHLDFELHSDKWSNCPICESKPLIWEFDNGRFGACKCATRYGKDYKVSATSIGKYYNEFKTFKGFNEYELRDNWNEHCKILKRQCDINKLI